MTKLALLTSASGGGAGIAAVRVYHSLLSVKKPDVKIDLLDIETLGYSIPIDVSPQTNASNKIISDTHFTIEYPGFVRSSLIEQLSEYDAINLHWCSFLISCTEIKLLLDLGKKILFTLHDFYYLLGSYRAKFASVETPNYATNEEFLKSWQSSETIYMLFGAVRRFSRTPLISRQFEKHIKN